MEFDSSWCPVCDRQILPKRFQVPVIPLNQQQPAPAPPPSSPQSSPTKTMPNLKRSKGTVRQRQGGLVQGTGRLKPNGTIKRTDSTKSTASQQSQQQQEQKPAQPVKLRTVIDQGPIPLYCSDECRLSDALHRGLPHNYNPERDGSLSHRDQYASRDITAESDSNSSSSIQSSITSDSSSSQLHTSPASSPSHISPSVAKLAAYYNFSIPTTAPISDDSSSSEAEYYPHEYNSGIMMAGKLIESMCPKPSKPSPSYRGARQPPKELPQVPGWTDGSNAWRSSVYSFSSPSKSSTDTIEEPSKVAAYRGFAASPHRSSHGVYSTVGESRQPTPTSGRSALSTGCLPTATNDMLSKFSQSLSRRSESRSSLYPGTSPAPSPAFPATAPAAPQRRERSLVKPGAEGKLLVPDVKLKVGSGSSASLSSAWSGPLSTSSRRSVRSPLSAPSCDGESSDEDSATQRCDSAASLPQMQRRPAVETRSWSYDNLKTYPIMQLPPKVEKRIKKCIIDGKEVEVEVEVAVEQTRKRLFLFPPSTRA